MDDLGREPGVGRRHRDPLARGGQRRLAVADGVVGPERRPDGAGDPVDHDVGQQEVLAEAGLDVAAAVAPRPELLGDPAGQPDGGVGQGVGQRLRTGPLDPLVAGPLLEPAVDLAWAARSSSVAVSRPGRASIPGRVNSRFTWRPATSVRVLLGHPGHHPRAPVAALHTETRSSPAPTSSARRGSRPSSSTLQRRCPGRNEKP